LAFYRETEFQETPIGKIPSDWTVTKLEEILHLRNGERPKISDGGGVPVYGANGIMGYTNEVLVDNDFTIVVGRVGASGQIHLGKGKIWVSDNAIYSENYANTRAHPPFLFYLLRHRKLDQFASKTTHPIITQTFLNNFLIHLPPLEEQRGIVGVLGVVDSVIAKAGEVVAKTERLKKGLMQTLLTRGIEHKEYKQTPIGTIPKEWNVLALQEICEVTDGSHWSPKEVEKSNYRIATVANLKETRIDIDSCKSISEADYQRLVKEGDIPEKGDIIFSKDGTVGICFAFNQSGNNIGLLSSIAIIRPDPTVLFPEFCAYALKSPNVFRQVIGWKTGTALRRITIEHLKTVKIPIPSLSEQQKIAEILSSVDMKLELEKKEKSKLERIKQGLMDLLLAGKIRVNVD